VGADTAASLLDARSGSARHARLEQTIRPNQNWVLDPVQDTLFIIAAPLLSLAVALMLMQWFGAERGAVMVIMAHVILTVAHHMPTFIRIYGDVDLFKRFKWNFVLAPLIPLTLSAVVLGYINYHHYPVEYFLYLFIMLVLWDPWHFLRQHFGFMRIYDRHNAAPVKLAANMDWWLCTAWFVHIMVASIDWLPGLLEDLYRSVNIPLLLAMPVGIVGILQPLTWWGAVLMSLVYVVYLGWCFKRGFYVSTAKMALMLCTFGVMYLTYTPNDIILQLVPAWSFKVGFATVGIVHMTQYLAIVWRYDQRIAQQGRARTGWFEWLHAQRSPLGIAVAAIAYVAFCVAYGNVITTSHDNRWLMSLLLAVGFTSTLLHYYYDGFIWKMRHQQNREALDLHRIVITAQSEPKFTATSWWSSATTATAGRMFMRQLLYFGLPMGILTIGAMSVWQADRGNYLQPMYQAQTLSEQGNHQAATESARKAYARMQAELPMARKLADLKPSSAHEASLAFLIYNESLYENKIMPQLAGKSSTDEQLTQHREHIAEASNLLLSAVYRGGNLAHEGRESLTADQATDIAMSWQHQLSH
jgi:Ca2+/Na+ antiporter